MNRAVAAILRLGTLAGVALAAAATAAYALRLGAAPALARAGVLVLLATPPVRPTTPRWLRSSPPAPNPISSTSF